MIDSVIGQGLFFTLFKPKPFFKYYLPEISHFCAQKVPGVK